MTQINRADQSSRMWDRKPSAQNANKAMKGLTGRRGRFSANKGENCVIDGLEVEVDIIQMWGGADAMRSEKGLESCGELGKGATGRDAETAGGGILADFVGWRVGLVELGEEFAKGTRTG